MPNTPNNTSSSQANAGALPPTPKQLAYLRKLAQRTGETCSTPRTRERAHLEIERLRRLTPTYKQLKYLRTLAQRRGQSFATPHTREQASEEIERLLGARSTGFTFAELEGEQAHRRSHDDAPLLRGASVRSDEVTGYGSSATWSQRS